jgi:hypothetical protein
MIIVYYWNVTFQRVASLALVWGMWNSLPTSAFLVAYTFCIKVTLLTP